MINPFILIAEDDADDRFLLQNAFAEKRYPERLEFAENGVELLKYLHDIQSGKTYFREYPTLILLDLNMPKKDGREALKEIKQHEEFKKIPVFIFTTTHNEYEINRCNELGANRYIVKPVTFEGLLAVLDEIHEYCSEISSKQMSA